MRRVLGFIPITIYALEFLCFVGFAILCFVGVFSSDDITMIFVFSVGIAVILGVVAMPLVLLILKILSLTRHMPVYGIICTLVDLMFCIAASRYIIYAGISNYVYVVLIIIYGVSFIANVCSIRT